MQYFKIMQKKSIIIKKNNARLCNFATSQKQRMRHLAYINIIVTFMGLILGSVIPHHHHKTLICTIEHLCEVGHEQEVIHDHETDSENHSETDEIFCPAHESYRTPSTTNLLPDLNTLSGTLTSQPSLPIPQILTHTFHSHIIISLTAQLICTPPLRAPPVCDFA